MAGTIEKFNEQVGRIEELIAAVKAMGFGEGDVTFEGETKASLQKRFQELLDAALLTTGMWQTTAQGVGQGIADIASLVAGSGGSDGTFSLGFSGGTQVIAPEGYFVVAGGVVTQVVITYSGHYAAGTPTLSFAPSAGLTGASATAVMGVNTPVGKYFLVPSSEDHEYAILYKNNTGVAEEQVRFPSSQAAIDALEAAATATEQADRAATQAGLAEASALRVDLGELDDAVAASEEAEAGAEAAKISAEAAAAVAAGAVSGSVNTFFAATKAAADALAAGLGDGATVIVDRDETLGGIEVRYTVASAALSSAMPLTSPTVAIMSDLAALPKPTVASGKTVVVGVGGFSDLGDGGDGRFYWQGNSSETPIAGMIVNPTGNAGAGRWKRSFSGALDPLWFGADASGAMVTTTELRAFFAYKAREHALGDDTRTFLVAPPVTGDVILPFTTRRKVTGAGATIKVKNSSGQFYSIMGSSSFDDVLTGTTVDGVIFDHNKANNTYTVTSNVLDQPHFTFVARKGEDISFINNKVLGPVCTNSVFINGVVSGVPVVKRVKVNNNKFLLVGGSAVAHDHSTVYISGDDAECIGNYGTASALGATGVACFLEPHSTHIFAAFNKAFNFDGFANITGVYSGGDTKQSIVAHNIAETLQFGIRIFSVVNAPHTTGYGIDGLDVADNQMRIFQSQLTAGSNKVYIGVAIQSGANLPVRNVRILRNLVEYDLETVAPSYTALSGSIGVNESSSNVTFEGIEIDGNTVINAPGPAIILGFGNGTFVNAKIGVNRLVNPGQSLSASVAAYKAGVWLGANLYSGSLKIARQSIIDTNAVTRLQNAIYAVPSSDSTAATIDAEADVTLTGDGAAFLRIYANPGNKTLPTLNARINKTPLFSSHTFKAGSEIEDTANVLKWRILVNGSVWTSHGYAAAAPVSGTHQVGSTRTYPVPVAGGYRGVVCTTAGSPGTWKTEGAISA